MGDVPLPSHLPLSLSGAKVSFLSPLPVVPSAFCAALHLHAGTVPTAPPQNVQAEAVNSTTVHFLWNPPPQQFINGINQGYKVPAWSGLGTSRWYSWAVLITSDIGFYPSYVIENPGQQIHSKATLVGPPSV